MLFLVRLRLLRGSARQRGRAVLLLSSSCELRAEKLPQPQELQE